MNDAHEAAAYAAWAQNDASGWKAAVEAARSDDLDADSLQHRVTMLDAVKDRCVISRTSLRFWREVQEQP